MKCEEVHLKAYVNAVEGRRGLGAYLRFYNDERPHQALGYRTPAEAFHEARNASGEESKVTADPPGPMLVSSAGTVGLSFNSTSILS